MASQRVLPTAKEMSIALICLVLVLGGAFLGAELTHRSALTQSVDVFALSPPDGTMEDIFEAEQRLALYRTFFTAWAALILVTPALCTFLFRRTSESAARYWLAFWTVSFIAFLVHFYWAVFILFDGDWSKITRARVRVTAPILDTVVAVWWGLDVLIAWGWSRIQRAIVHIAVFALFFSGSALQGEHNGKEGKTIWSVAFGIAMAVAVLISALIWLVRWLKKSRRRDAPAS